MGIRDPYLSHNAPKTKRMQTSKATAAMFVVHICCVDKFKSRLIIGNNGAIANHMKNAMKNDHHAMFVVIVLIKMCDRRDIGDDRESWKYGIRYE